MSLLLDDYIKRNPDSLCTISHDRLGIKLSGIISDPQLIQSLSAQYGNSMVSNVSSAGGYMQATGDKLDSKGKGKMANFSRNVGSALSMFGSYATSQHTLMGTIKTYEGSGDINLPVNMTLFYGWGGNPEFKEMDKKLNLITQPLIHSGGLLGSNLYESEDLLQLALLNTDLFKGKLLSIRLGSWLLAKDCFMTSLNKNYHTNTNEDGKPIAVQISFQITPYRQLSAEELSSWIL